MRRIKGAIFDLDGVVVDTAKYHYQAWKELARSLGFEFTERDNERLKGVSRMRSLDILLEIGGIAAGDAEKELLADAKNSRYVELLSLIDESAVLGGAKEYLAELRARGVKTALGSASKNARLILERLDLAHAFDAVVDGNAVTAAKPDPEVFLKGASGLGLDPAECVVFEDSIAGIEAARRAGMAAIGVGTPETLPGANRWISSLADMRADPEPLADAVYA